MKKTWSILKEIVNKGKQSQIQSKLKVSDNSITTNKTLISDKFNDFFTSIGPSLAKKIPQQNVSPMEYMKEKLVNSMFMEPVKEDEVTTIISNLKNSAPGHDEITAGTLKGVLAAINHPLVYILNLSLSEGLFPDELKIANVVPIYKADHSMQFNNYRPVSLLCTLSKVFEKVMYTRLSSFLESQKILFDKQFGFRKQHSTYMALLILMDKLIKSIQCGNYVIGVFLDFSKAFDTVNHSILLDKLYHYGIRDNTLKWFQSYLTQRKQYVTYNSTPSSIKPINCGVPQGSILGPLLFLIYINDPSNVCKYTMPILFADDSNIFSSSDDIQLLQSQINEDLNNIAIWLKVNKLSLNIKKTHFMIFTKRKNKVTDVAINIEGNAIAEVSQTKFLGVYIDNKLTWKKHIHYIAGKLSRGIGLVAKARKLLNYDALITLYYSFIYPYLCYCNHVWGSTYVSNLQKLIILQKRIIRMIMGAKPRDHTEPMFLKLGLLKFVDINKYMIAVFMHRNHIAKTPDVFIDYFKKIQDVHHYATRSCSGLYAMQVKTDLGKTSISYIGPIIWNKILSIGINPDTSECVFSKSLKTCIRTNLF